MPPGLDNRDADNWRLLFAVADEIGEDWRMDGDELGLAREAALKLTDANDSMDAAVQALADLLVALAGTDLTRPGRDGVTSAQAALLLADIEGSPWAEYGQRERPISKNQ